MCKQSNISLEELRDLLNNPKLRKREASEPAALYRSEFERDCSRILYSSSFRRLQEKMQLIGVETAAFHRNRLTHSLEVQRVSHSIANYVNHLYKKYIYDADDISLLDAAALAHDIGHPAFGHKGERVLDEIAKQYGLRFEGNAQNYRVLRKLDRNSVNGEGLNLTYRTLFAINKYCNTHRSDPEKFMYDEDYDALMKVRKECGLGDKKTLDVQIIELADDIAYATHDLEDGLCLSVTTLEELIYAIKTYSSDKYSAQELYNAGNLFEDAVSKVLCGIEEKAQQVNQQQFMHLFRKGLTSELLTMFVENIHFDGGELKIKRPYEVLCKVLSKVTFRNVTRNTNIVRYEARGEIVIKSLFNIYANEKINKNYSLLPPDYQPKKDYGRCKIARTVIDYIAGMSDTFAIAQYKQLTGGEFEDIDIAQCPTVYEIPRHIGWCNKLRNLFKCSDKN